MVECLLCKNKEDDKFALVRLEEYYTIYKIGALLCLVCGLVFVEEDELEKRRPHYYK